MTIFDGLRESWEQEQPAANENLPGYRPSLLDRTRARAADIATVIVVGAVFAVAISEVASALLMNERVLAWLGVTP